MEFTNLYIHEVYKNRNYISKKIFGNIGKFNIWGEIATIYRLPVNIYVEPIIYSISITYDEPLAIFNEYVQKFIRDECQKLLEEKDCRGIL